MPLMSLFIPPQLAAGIMLPLLVVMDVLNLWRYRHDWQWRHLRAFLPGAVVGILIGWMLFSQISASGMRIGLGALALFLVLRRVFQFLRNIPKEPVGKLATGILGTLSGLGSTIAHAGGPPADAYFLSQRDPKTVLVASNIYVFFVINALKIGPYIQLGLFSPGNLKTSLWLLPLVPLGVWLGHRLHHRVSQKMFELIAYLLLTCAGGKLILDGVMGLTAV